MNTVPDPVNPRPVEHLYRLLGTSGVLLYVGITNNWPSRMKQHMADKPWWGEVAGVELVGVIGTRAQLEAIERAVIKAERPIHNVAHNHKPVDTRTDTQIAVDELNEMFVEFGMPPVAYVRQGDRASAHYYLVPELRRRAVHIVGWYLTKRRDESSAAVRCAWRAKHDCTTTASVAASGFVQCFHGPQL